MSELNHFDHQGNAIMVDVSGKPSTMRVATAVGEIGVCPAIMEMILKGTSKKGDVLGVARIAGIMATKQTSNLIPLCHPLPLQKCTIDFETEPERGIVRVLCTVKTQGTTGVEMEALTGVNIALLTIYDMCKAVDKTMVLGNIHLVSKSGGKSGNFKYVRV